MLNIYVQLVDIHHESRTSSTRMDTHTRVVQKSPFFNKKRRPSLSHSKTHKKFQISRLSFGAAPRVVKYTKEILKNTKGKSGNGIFFFLLTPILTYIHMVYVRVPYMSNMSYMTYLTYMTYMV